VCAFDYATPGVFDRAGNIKFQDFIEFPFVAHLIAQGRANQLYDDQMLARQIRAIAGRDTSVQLQYFYGPQVALLFLPFPSVSFLEQAGIWVTLSLLLYLGCLYLIWKSCPSLKAYPGIALLCAVAFPPVFHFFVRGQISAVVLLCFTVAYLAFLANHDWLAGIALGFLLFKPPFVVGVAVVLFFSQAWKAFAGIALSAAIQFALTFFYFGRDVMRPYMSRMIGSASRPELSLSPIQMHSLRSFWVLLVPSPTVVWVLYLLSSLAAITVAVRVWRSPASVGLRFSALVLASVLVSPHILIYDLLMLAPALLLLADWCACNPQHHSTPTIRVLLYLAFLLPLFGPLARWTHLQVSAIVFAGLLWAVYRVVSLFPRLASAEAAVV
jgi:hypothetical protein